MFVSVIIIAGFLNQMVLPLRIPIEKMYPLNSYEKQEGQGKINVGKQSESLLDLSEKKENQKYYDPCWRLMKIPTTKLCYNAGHSLGGSFTNSITNFCAIMQKYAANKPQMAKEIINHVENIVNSAVACASSSSLYHDHGSPAINHHLRDPGHILNHHILDHVDYGNSTHSHGPYVNPGHAIRKILYNGTNGTHQHYYGNYSDHSHYGNYSGHHYYGNYSGHHYYGNYSGNHYGNYSGHHYYGNYSDPHYYSNYSDHHGHYDGNFSNHLHPEIVIDDHHGGLVQPHIDGYPHPHAPVVVSSNSSFDSHHPQVIISSDHHLHDDHAIGTIIDHRGDHFHGNYSHWGNYSADHHVHPDIVNGHVDHELVNPHIVGTPHGGHGHPQVIVGHLG